MKTSSYSCPSSNGSDYTYEIFYSKLTEVTGTWVNCSFKTTNCAVISHLKKLQQQEDKGIVKGITARATNSIIG